MNFETPNNNSVENQESAENKVEAIAVELAEEIAKKIDLNKVETIHQAAEEFKQAA